MDFLFQRGKASVGEVMDGIPNPPGYSAVRATLRTLEQKGRVVHAEDGRAYVYRPTLRREAARRSALTHVLKTFFDNSAEQAVAALLELKGPKLSEAELERVARLVADAKKEGR
jgi:predicted transcriptional regulator